MPKKERADDDGGCQTEVSKSRSRVAQGRSSPLSWASSMEIARTGESRPQLHPRQAFTQAHELEDVLESSSELR